MCSPLQIGMSRWVAAPVLVLVCLACVPLPVRYVRSVYCGGVLCSTWHVLPQVWDAHTGQLVREFPEVVDSDITDMTFDSRQRKFILATQRGDINVYNCLNGALMKEFHHHHSEVSAITFSNEDQVAFSVSWDRSLQIHDEESETGELLRMVRALLLCLCVHCVLWLCGCGCVALWLCGCVAAWLCGCVAAWLRGCVAVAVWLYCYVDVWLCVRVWLHLIPPVWFPRLPTPTTATSLAWRSVTTSASSPPPAATPPSKCGTSSTSPSRACALATTAR